MNSSVPIALLRHDLADGSAHVDLMVATPGAPIGDDDRTVACWRCPVRPDESASAAQVIERIDDHRGWYLRLTQPSDLSGNRGRVLPLRAGRCERRDSEGGVLYLAITWEDGGRNAWSVTRIDARTWLLQSQDSPPARSGKRGAEERASDSES